MAPGQAIEKSNSDYVELLEKLDDIPTLPIVAMKVNELTHDPKSSSSDIADLLKEDQVLTAKILRLANSSYYAIPGGVKDVQRALAFLGFNTLAQLILGLSVFSVFKEMGDGQNLKMLDFWRHALGAAVGSEILSKELKLGKPEEMFTCGLLHDIGKLVLHEIDPNRLAFILEAAEEKKCSFYDVEKEDDLPNHAFLGEAMAERWGLPQLICKSIRHHHQDVQEMSTLLESEKAAVQIVRLANQICIKNEIGKSGDCSSGEVSFDMLHGLGLEKADLDSIEMRVEKGMERAGGLLSAYR